MAEYIEREALIKALNSNTVKTWGKGKALQGVHWSHAVAIKNNLVDVINNQPTVEAPNIVKCGECYMSGKCKVEEIFDTVRMPDSKKFCAVGCKRKARKEVQE